MTHTVQYQSHRLHRHHYLHCL